MRGVALLLLTCCGAVEAPRAIHARTGAVTYDVPEGWGRIDTKRPGIATTVWTPTDNPQRISLTVIDADPPGLSAQLDASELTGLLMQAQNGLDEALISSPTEARTQSGLRGARIELDFNAPTAKARYHRSHVVLIDGKSIIHVMLTAQSVQEFASLDAVMATIRHEEHAL